MSDWGAVHSTEKAALAGLDQESGIELDWTLNGAIFFTDRLKDALAAGASLRRGSTTWWRAS